MPHNAMALLFGAAFGWAILAIVTGCVAFWRDIGEPTETLRDPKARRERLHDAATLEYLDDGGRTRSRWTRAARAWTRPSSCCC